ncbi:MAG: UDP-glucose 4-epimerase [Chitinophagaceae bacterium]|nr:UDP-glucose 4-epimerase [Chitinophagaceae bacterium]
MKKIIVTGGCGYIGSQTIIELLKHTEYEVISIDNLVNSAETVLQRIKLIAGKEVINYKVDLCDYNTTRQVFQTNQDVVGVIHFAALKSVGDSVSQPVRYYHNNIESLLNVIKCCQEFHIDNFIFSSSCSVYGNVASLPVKEETSLSPVVSPYAHTKLMAEQMLRFIADQATMNFILLRYFNPVGGDTSGMNGEDPVNPPSNLIPVITQTAAGIREKMTVFGNDYPTRDGSCIRDYIHVIDIADAHIKAMNRLVDKKNKDNYEIYNLGTGEGVSVFEAIKAFEEVTGVSLNYEVSPRRPGDVASIYSDSTKANIELGWKPAYSIKEMMSTAWKWQLYINSISK